MSDKPQKLALLGGVPFRTKKFSNWPEFNKSDIDGLMEVVNSGIWSRANYTSHLKFKYENQSKVGQFEKVYTDYLGTKYGIFVNSGTSALHLAFAALDLEKGSEVITTPYTFFSTVAPLYKYDLKPVFADIDENGNLDPVKVIEKITPNSKAILLMHCAGYPCEMEAFSEICKKNGLYLIQDCAHAVTSTYSNKHVAAYGDIAIFSFEVSKNLNSGEGGFVATTSEELFLKMYSIQSCGRPVGGEWRSHVYMSENYRPTEFQGALARTQFEKVPEQSKRREKNEKYLDAALENHPLVEPVKLKGKATSHGNYSYVLKIRDGFRGKVTGKRLAIYLETEGIPCHSGYTHQIFDIEYSKQFFTEEEREDFKKECVVSERFIKSTVWLPQTILISSIEDIKDVIGAIDKIYKCISN